MIMHVDAYAYILLYVNLTMFKEQSLADPSVDSLWESACANSSISPTACRFQPNSYVLSRIEVNTFPFAQGH